MCHEIDHVGVDVDFVFFVQSIHVSLGLLDLASAYCESELKSRCEQLMRQSVGVDNVAQLYATAIKYDAQVRAPRSTRPFTLHSKGVRNSNESSYTLAKI